LKRSRLEPTGGVLYDTGALVAAERADDQVWFMHHRLLARRIRPIVPSVVLAQAWRGGPQANLSRLLRGCVIETLAENAAREIGRLLAMDGSSDIVAAAVVLSAASRGDLVVTSDPDDLSRLSEALDVHLSLQVI
jgi:hypothetical protein